MQMSLSLLWVAPKKPLLTDGEKSIKSPGSLQKSLKDLPLGKLLKYLLQDPYRLIFLSSLFTMSAACFIFLSRETSAGVAY